MENQNLNRDERQTEQKQPEPEKQAPQGWKDVVITPDMPLAALVQFFNILNQRLCNVEDNLAIAQPDGSQVSLTQIYAAQAEAERLEQVRQNEETEGE